MHRYRKIAATAALALGLAAGSYGVASAATGSGSGSSSTGGTSLAAIAAQASPPVAQQPWGHQRSDETSLTGETKSKVEAAAAAAAAAKLPAATIVRTETDADGNAAYEVHMVQADGTPATVYVDKQFDVISVQTGMPGAPRQQSQSTA
jgi:uncharacterized membrane protein YkoI